MQIISIIILLVLVVIYFGLAKMNKNADKRTNEMRLERKKMINSEPDRVKVNCHKCEIAIIGQPFQIIDGKFYCYDCAKIIRWGKRLKGEPK